MPHIYIGTRMFVVEIFNVIYQVGITLGKFNQIWAYQNFNQFWIILTILIFGTTRIHGLFDHEGFIKKTICLDTCQKDHLVILDKSISTMSKLINDLFD